MSTRYGLNYNDYMSAAFEKYLFTEHLKRQRMCSYKFKVFEFRQFTDRFGSSTH